MQPPSDLIARIVFRRFRPEDKDAVQRLHVAALESTNAYITVENYYADLDDIEGTYLPNGGEFLVGELDGQIVAMGGFSPKSETTVEMRRARVAPHLQGAGIGPHLLALREAEARK